MTPSDARKRLETNYPPPGSRAALDMGCKCPVVDNAYGRGCVSGNGVEPGTAKFFVREDCPMHGSKVEAIRLGCEETKG